MLSAGSVWPSNIRPLRSNPLDLRNRIIISSSDQKCPSDADTEPEPESDMELEDISDVLMDLVLVMREVKELLLAMRCTQDVLPSNVN